MSKEKHISWTEAAQIANQIANERERQYREANQREAEAMACVECAELRAALGRLRGPTNALGQYEPNEEEAKRGYVSVSAKMIIDEALGEADRNSADGKDSS